MTEEERKAIVDEITQNVLTALSQNAIDWSANKIEFTSPSAITVATREKVLVPAIDTRENKRIYGNLDLNTLLSAYGLQEAKKVIDIVENTGDVVVGELATAKDEAIAEIDSKTESEKAELSTHSEAEKGTISSATSNAISSIQQAKDSANDEVSATASTKKNEINAIVATGISKIEQTTTSTESEGSNVLTITQTNGTPTQFIVRNGAKGEKGANGEPINTVNFPLTGNAGTVYVSANVGKITNGQGFSVIIQSRAGETVWVNVTANDAGFEGYAIRMSNTHGKTSGIWYDQSTGYLYTLQNAWSNLVSFTVIATTFSVRQPTVAQVSSIPSTATKIDITDIALKSDLADITSGKLTTNWSASQDSDGNLVFTYA